MCERGRGRRQTELFVCFDPCWCASCESRGTNTLDSVTSSFSILPIFLLFFFWVFLGVQSSEKGLFLALEDDEDDEDERDEEDEGHEEDEENKRDEEEEEDEEEAADVEDEEEAADEEDEEDEEEAADEEEATEEEDNVSSSQGSELETTEKWPLMGGGGGRCCCRMRAPFATLLSNPALPRTKLPCSSRSNSRLAQRLAARLIGL